MKVELKELKNTRWFPVQAERLVGKPINQFLLEALNPMVACIYDQNGKKAAFISNADEYVEMYRPHGLSLSARQLQELLGSDIIPPVLINTFPDADFMEVKSLNGAES